MTRIVRRAGALAWLALALLAPALAAELLATEEAEVRDRGRCELKVKAAWRHGDGERERGGDGKLTCGVGLDSQLFAALGRTVGGGRAENEVALGGRTRLAEPTPATALALGYEAGWVWPGRRGASPDEVHVAALLSHEIGRGWSVHGNLGRAWRRGDDDPATWGLAVKHAFDDRHIARLEAARDADGGRWVGASVRWIVDDGLALGAYLARQTHGERATLGVLGVGFSF